MQNEWLRYSCQMALPHFGVESQKRLQQAKVLVVGAGGLGCPAAQYLAAAGIGTLGIADFDVVTISNLHRQILYTPEEVGASKAVVAARKLQQQNPHIKVIPHNEMLTANNIMETIADYTIVVDGTDNFATRYLLNDACVLAGKPLVYGAIYQYEGQVSIWNVANKDGTRTPNYRDLFPEANTLQVPNCAEGGVIPTLAGIIGCMQANEVLKYITQTGTLLSGKLLLFDAQTMQSRTINIGTVSTTTITSLPTTLHIPLITVEALKSLLQKNEVELVDVRTTAERNLFHIGGMHVPAAEIKDSTTFSKAHRPIVFYCASGKRSGEVVKELLKNSPDGQFTSLRGGLKAWKEAGYG